MSEYVEPNWNELFKKKTHKDGMRICSSCSKPKPDEEYMAIEHKTCQKCIMRVRTWERKNKKAYFGHMR